MGARAKVGQRGFTFLELIVVLFVLGLTASLTLPSVGRTLDGLRLRAEVAAFTAVLRHAREQAITSRRAQLVVVDPDQHRVVAGPVGASDDERRTRPLPAEWTVEASPPARLSVRFEPPGSSSGADLRILSGAIRYRVTVDGLTGRVKTDRE